MQGPVNIFPSLRTIRDANIEGLKHDPEIKFVLSDLELERGETDEGDASTDVGAAAAGVGADAGVVHEQFAPEAPAVFEPMDGVTPAGEATAAAAAAGEEAVLCAQHRQHPHSRWDFSGGEGTGARNSSCGLCAVVRRRSMRRAPTWSG